MDDVPSGEVPAFSIELDHIQITVEADAEKATLEFYRNVFGLPEIEKPDLLKKNGGAWFKVGALELHVSPESRVLNNGGSKRHVCYRTRDLESFRRRLEMHGAEIIEDNQP